MSERTYDVEVISGPEGKCLALGETGTGSATRIAGPKPWGGGTIVDKFVVDEADLLGALADERHPLFVLRKRAVEIVERRQYAAGQLPEGSKERTMEEGVATGWAQVVELIDAQGPHEEAGP